MHQKDELWTRGVEEVIGHADVLAKIQSKGKIRVKFGIDPTVDSIHIGNAVPLRKLAQFQKAGHDIVLIIGDFTASIGDPAGRNKLRPPLTREQIKENVKDYINQASKIIDVQKATIHFNSEWFDEIDLRELIALAQNFTVNQLIERDDFDKRLSANQELWLHEILYPVMQGYDSVKLDIDLEIGGTDQKFNMLAGRQLQKKMGQDPQAVLTVPLLVGTDGTKKMSKSLGNFIAVNDFGYEMYSKIMSIPDSLIESYFMLCTDMAEDEISEISRELVEGSTNPKQIKQRLAHMITTIYHNAKEADIAASRFDSVFSKSQIPDDMPEIKLVDSQSILQFLTENKLVSSNSEARRLISQRGVKVDQKVVESPEEALKVGESVVVQVGKRVFVRIVA